MTNVLLRRFVLFAWLFSLLACAGKTCADSADEVPRELTRGQKQHPGDGLSVIARDFLDPSGRGPTGQWPSGFPAYSTEADIVTNGTNSGLISALDDATCSDGCVIEHPGNISAVALTRVGTGEIVVRPPVGRRAQYTFVGKVDIRDDNLLIAGFDNDSYMVVSKGTNSGFAWMEIDGPGGGLAVHGNGDIASGFYYEIVYRQYAAPGTGDRGGVRASSNGSATMLVVGSILTGTTDPPPVYHADTLQIYYDSSAGGAVTIRDSVVWPAYDKALQAGAVKDFFLDNVFIMAPSEANVLWPGPGSLNLGGYYHTTGSADMNNCTIVGRNHPDFKVHVSNSKLWGPGTYADRGGNTILDTRPSPPSVPTHTQLDAIWSR